MARRSIQERLRQLEARRDVLVARLGKQQRARDTRRKILIGALVLDRIERQPEQYLSSRLDEWLRTELPGFLTRENDRALFDDILGPSMDMRTSTGTPDASTGNDGEEQP
ncbi:mobilization protein [Allorhizobium sp. NPDC080224]|uniref:mobilization protein n=1 Tax=Allorhizobium sp. NPDC080224 TaxID=3390547 RepID=UPI003D008E6B